MLVRHYIHQRLKEYYAQAASSVVGGMTEPIAFRSLWGQWHWNYVYGKIYERQVGQWLTPSELFQPYYSQCLAEWVVSRINTIASFPPTTKVRLMELGGGRGTNALCLLDYIQHHHPTAYEQIDRYVLVDSSESLLQLQQERTKDCAKIGHWLCDLQNVAEGKETLVSANDLPTIVLALEVLDNLPHDQIIQRNGKFYQVDLVRTMMDGRYQEIERRLTDPLLQQCVSVLAPSSLSLLQQQQQQQQRSVQWYPTIALGVLSHLLTTHPHVELLIADFDMLPGNNPLVTDMNKNDYVHYLQTPSSPTDILFATDFELLAKACRNLSSNHHQVSVTKQGDFLKRYPHIVRQTKSRMFFSPMVDSFSNCSILTVETTQN